jgi:hypothetical protein
LVSFGSARGEADHDAAVLPAALAGAGHGLALAEGAHLQAGRVDAALLQVGGDRTRAPFAQLLVVLVAAALVGVAVDLGAELVAIVEEIGGLVEGGGPESPSSSLSRSK